MKKQSPTILEACISPPPSQSKIMSSWKTKSCKVSICMLTYNHEKYISCALNSALNQITNFPFEILIHDDASSDQTPEIIREFHKLYPDIVKPIYQKQNQHSQNINPSVHFNYTRCKGEYIAFLEGDDYWCDPYKLQLQADTLDKNKNFNLCFHQAYRINYFNNNQKITTIGNYAKKNATIPFENTLFLTHGMVPTASCMVRHNTIEKLRLFMKERPHLTLGDRFMQFFGSYPNGSLYINKAMSAYRLGTEGSWSASIANNPEHKTRHEKVMLLAFTELNREVNNKLSDMISVIYLQRLLWFFRPTINQEQPLKSSILDKPSVSFNAINDPGIKVLEPKFIYIQNEILKTLKKWNNQKGTKIIYGAGSGCKIISDTIGSLNITAIIDRDNKRTGETFNSSPIVSVKDLKRYNSPKILVSVPSSSKAELNNELNKYGVSTDSIYYLFESSINWLTNNPFTEKELEEVYKSIFIYKKSY